VLFSIEQLSCIRIAFWSDTMETLNCLHATVNEITRLVVQLVREPYCEGDDLLSIFVNDVQMKQPIRWHFRNRKKRQSGCWCIEVPLRSTTWCIKVWQKERVGSSCGVLAWPRLTSDLWQLWPRWKNAGRTVQGRHQMEEGSTKNRGLGLLA
jgi:hypothetical protein